MTDDSLSELLAIFTVEAAEHLATLNQTLLMLETTSESDDGARRGQIELLERAAHSLKGAARGVGIATVETIAHRLESVFEAVRDHKMTLSPNAADTLYDAFDTLQAVLDNAEPETIDNEPVLAALDALLNMPNSVPSAMIRAAPRAVQETQQAPLFDPLDPLDLPTTADAEPSPAPQNARADETIRVAVARLDSLMADASDLLVERGSIEQRVSDIRVLRKAHQRWQKDWRRVRTAYIRAVRAAQTEWPTLLEFLNSTQRYMRASGQQLTLLERALTQDSLRLGLIADSLQDSTRRVRLVPFETHVALLQRTVRDVARQENKEVLLQISGGVLELDKRVLEAIKDPLIHLLRNAVDHGIEPPDERVRLGKSRVGLILLVVAQRGGDVTLLVCDDGAGIDVAAVRQRARRFRSAAEIDALSDSEALMLTLMPGLSTSQQVTTISGRGIGLDIVRENIEAMQGRIVIESAKNQGTTFRLTLPSSLSTLRCMLVRIGAETYAIPTTAIEQIVHISADDTFMAGGRAMLRVGGQPIGLVSLCEVIERPGSEHPTYALILAMAERRMAFRVDDVITEQETVVKTLNPELTDVPHVAGATLLGTGEVVIILNVSDLFKTAQGAAVQRRTAPITAPAAEVTRILIVDDSITTRTLEKNILEAAGYDVLTATNGLEAFDLLATAPCDLIVSDVEMPYMDGFELTRRIRHSDRFARLPIILVTSLDSLEQRERGLQVGADHYIVKGGFDQQELLATIRQLLG